MKTGDIVTWKWGNGSVEGRVKSVHQDDKEITTAGKRITKHGSKDNPALVIAHDSGHDVLKLASEVKLKKKD